MKFALLFSRLLVGLLFIFSGLIKANDPLGFSYKMEEYFVVFGTEWLTSLSLPLSMLICVLEIVLGAAVLLGTFMPWCSWLLLVLILFFTWLTGFSAVTGEVTDCGCFGDAIQLTPWESFLKDIILLGLIVIIFKYRHTIRPLGAKAHVGTYIAGAFTLLFTLYCYAYLPIVDFRPYKVDNNIHTLMQDGEAGEYETILVYRNKNTGKTEAFTATELGGLDQSVWEYHDRKDKVINPGKPATIEDFAVYNAEDDNVTELLLTQRRPLGLVIAYDLKKTSTKGLKKAVSLATGCSDMEFAVLTASSYRLADSLRHELQAPFKFFFTDATVLKTIIRSNPGLVLLKEGTVKGKWDHKRMPDCKQLKMLARR